jgi:hypothetical protein
VEFVCFSRDICNNKLIIIISNNYGKRLCLETGNYIVFYGFMVDSMFWCWKILLQSPYCLEHNLKRNCISLVILYCIFTAADEMDIPLMKLILLFTLWKFCSPETFFYHILMCNAVWTLTKTLSKLQSCFCSHRNFMQRAVLVLENRQQNLLQLLLLIFIKSLTCLTEYSKQVLLSSCSKKGHDVRCEERWVKMGFYVTLYNMCTTQ